MTRFVLETRLPPDPLLLAQRAWQGELPMLLWSRDGSGPSYLGCDAAEVARGLDPEPTLEDAACVDCWSRVPRWLGVLPYEAQRERLERPAWVEVERRPAPLIEHDVWWRYPAVAVVERRVTIVADDRPAALQLLARLEREQRPASGVELLAVDLGGGDARHERRIRDALELIRQGEVYQVNLARRLELRVRGEALALLDQMGARARAPYCAAFCTPDGAEVISTSPELLLHSEARRVITLPIKGTRPRGADAREDAALALALDADEKERAELAMVVDIERSDLGRVARFGSVVAEPPRVVRHTGVWHRQAQVSAALCAHVGRAELLRAMLPSGSVTGAPKVRTMELISQLEDERRGLYTGGFGFVTRGGGLELAMAIRTLCRRGEVGHYWVGGGIVAESDPAREVVETRWKARQLEALIRR